MHIRMVLSIVTLLVVTACVPYRLTERPLVVGSAISDPGREPLGGAAVKLRLMREGKVFETHDLTTDKKGRFKLTRQSSWSITDRADWTSYTVRVEIQSPGYVATKREIRWLDSGPGTLDFGALRLRATAQ